MKILVIIYEYPPVGGGGGRIAADLCRVLARRGHDLRVLTSRVGALPAHERSDGVAVLRRFAFRQRADRCTIPEMAGYVLAQLPSACALAAGWRPDVLHAHFAVPSGAVTLPAAWLTRTPYVLTAHLGDVPGGVPDQTDRVFRWIKPLTVPIWKRAAAVTAVSDYTRDLVVAAYGVPVETIRNGVDLARVVPSPREPHNPPQLVWVGRCNAQKNLGFLAEWLHRAADCAWHMHVIGDGDERPALVARVRDLGLSEQVTFHGWLHEKQVNELLRRSDILLLPSLSEGLSLVGINSLAHGLAVIASRIPGNADLVRPGYNGYLCELNDAEGFAAALRSLLADAERLARMKSASRAQAQAFDLDRSAARYERIYERVCR
jgi:glycosyltransferase involved in cell wall biosynthesis